MRRTVLGVGVTSLGQIVVGVSSGVQAILVAAIFGATAGTDGFFAAYGAYSLAVLVAQSWRVTLVGRLVESDAPFASFNRFCGAAGLLFVIYGILFVGLGGPLASVLTGGLPQEARDSARESLLIFWPAAGAQLVAALAAAMLGVLGDYGRAAFAYALGGLVSIAGFVALQPSLGITALATSILIGTVVTTVPLLHALVRAGWRPTRSIVAQLGENARAAGLAIVSSLTNVLVFLVYLLSLAFAARLGSGMVTIYSYAYFALGLATTLVGSSVMIVLAAPIASNWDRNPASLRPHVDDVFRMGLMIVIPVAAAAALLGDDIASALLTDFSTREVEALVTTFLILTPSLVTSVAVTIPSVALFTLGRYRARAGVALVVLLLHAAFSTVALATGSLAALAAAAGASSVTGLIGVLWLLHGRAFTDVLRRLLKQLLGAALPAAACFAAAAAAFHYIAPSPLGHAGALAVGLFLYGCWIAAFMPAQRSLLLRLAGALRPV